MTMAIYENHTHSVLLKQLVDVKMYWSLIKAPPQFQVVSFSDER